ncbi:MAG TPA: nucleotide disphospho-sugar-binding domain-containing protein, partial [Thermoleophilaceae bacterium]|nr:nucleotide disphospho-sugar-binding domain-containing protein [Thermoleophilaceae bacterium]
EHASVAISHGGHGTTVKALAAGVPTLVLPLGRDQPDVGARVEHSGAGLRLKQSAKPAAIAAAVADLLEDPRYREAAGRMAAAIGRDTATDMAVAELEAVAQDSKGATP